MSKKEKKDKKEESGVIGNCHPLIKEIVNSYPKNIECFPRERFESQLRNHLKRFIK